MKNEEILNLICEALEVPEGSILRETQVADVAEWDSIGWLTIMSLLDERYGIQINAQEIRDVETAGDLVDLILKKKGS